MTSRAIAYRAPILFLTVLIIATSGLVYELVTGALASYVLGDSVTQFSTTIGVYLFAMGIGSYLSKFIKTRVAMRFVEVELGAAIVGGLSAPILFVTFAHSEVFSLVMYSLIIVIGTLVGLEIPLLMRILKDELDFEELIAKVLSVDYLGALAGSLLFALVLVPKLGLNRTSIIFGLLNCLVAFMATYALTDLMDKGTVVRLRLKAVVVFLILLSAFVWSNRITDFTEQAFYPDTIVYAKQSRYQRIVVTKNTRSVQLFLNGNLQFSSQDEYRYHEALVHPAFAVPGPRARALVLGGGDGLAVRELLRYPEMREVVLVDLDSAVTDVANQIPDLLALNQGSLRDPRVTTVHADAMIWLQEEAAEPFDVVIVDFPDPNNFSLGKLYSRRFYHLLAGVMHEQSRAVVQSTSPLFARRSFWCIERTLSESGFWTAPFHATVPSFGEWGFVLAMKQRFDPPRQVPTDGLRFLTDQTLQSLFVFSADMGPVPVETNRLNNQHLVQYYQDELGSW